MSLVYSASHLLILVLVQLWPPAGAVTAGGSDGSGLSTQAPPSSDVPFLHVTIDAHGPDNMHTKSIGDFNGDGYIDLLVAGTGGTICWYEHPSWARHIVATSGGGWSTDAEAGDIDGDGDQDFVISDWYESRRLVWFENPSPTGDPRVDPWSLHVIGSPRAHDIELRDLDGDGDLDIVSRQQGGAGVSIVLWRQNSPQDWVQHVISTPRGEGLHLGDLDRDGDPDVITGGRWYENDGNIIDGKWTEHIFADNWNHEATFAWMADINDDGRADVVLTPSESTGGNYRTSWFEAPVDPTDSGWTEHVIDSSVETVTHSLGVADMDRDGDLDVVTAEMHQGNNPDEVRIYANSGGGLVWTKQVVAVTGSHDARVIDVDRDGDFDIFGANWTGTNVVDLWENLAADGNADLADYAAFPDCMTGPKPGPYAPACEVFNFDADNDIDLRDLARFMRIFSGS